MEIHVGTFNILDPHFAERHNQVEGLSNGKSNWNSRKDHIISLLKESNLDVLCLQEVSRKSFNDMQANLQRLGYETIHTPHNGRSDGLAILYKKDKLDKKDNIQVLSKHGLNSCIIDLKEKTTGKLIRVANCHLLGGPRSNEGAEQINELVQQMENQRGSFFDASIITGDFNADETDMNHPKFRQIRASGYNHDGNLTPTEPGKNRHIDWIWVRFAALYNSNQLTSIHIHHPSTPVSDHRLLATRITLGSVPSSAPPLSQESHIPKVTFEPSQPLGSLRSKIITYFKERTFSLTLESQTFLIKQLDHILSLNAQLNRSQFLPAVVEMFNSFLKQHLSDIEVMTWMNHLTYAIQKAQNESNNSTASHFQAKPSVSNQTSKDTLNAIPKATTPEISIWQSIVKIFNSLKSFFVRFLGMQQ